MGIFYSRKQEKERDNNTADPWNNYGIDFGKDKRADSEKATAQHRKTSKDLPTALTDNCEDDNR